MAELKALPTAVLLHIAKLLNVPMKGLQAVIELSDPAKFFPWRMAEEDTPERFLTGADADPESLVAMHLSTSKIRTYAAPRPKRITGWPITGGSDR